MADYRKARQQARQTLEAHQVDHPPVDVRLIAENEGIRVMVRDLEDRISGLLVRKGDSAAIGVNARHHANRQRFTLAHELGHFHLHSRGPTVVYYDDTETMVHFRAEGAYPPSSKEEVEANTYAASLLMPEDFLRQDLREQKVDANDETAIRRLAKRYQVSPQALTIRLMDLGLLRGLGTSGM